MFRRERPQKGRYRQFFQIDAEVIGPASSGSESPARDAEILELVGHPSRSRRHHRLDARTQLGRLPGRPRPLLTKRCARRSSRWSARCALIANAAPLLTHCACSTAKSPKTSRSSTRFRASASSRRRLPHSLRASQRHPASVGVPSVLNAVWSAASTTTRAPRSSSRTEPSAHRMRSSAADATTDCLKPSAGRPALESASPSAKIGWFSHSPPPQNQFFRNPDVYIAPLGAGMNREAARLARELRRSQKSRRRTWRRNLPPEKVLRSRG